MKIKQRENFPVYGTLCILVWHINFEAAIMLQISIFYCSVNMLQVDACRHVVIMMVFIRLKMLFLIWIK